MGWISALVTTLFGSSSNGKGVVGEVSDAVDRWYPSDATLHEQNIEDQQAGDESQRSAREMQLPYHESWFDILIDGLNRLVRPIITYWVIGGLIGLWVLPPVGTVDPIVMNIVWTVVTFWFGSRMLFKDIPAIFRVYKSVKTIKKAKDRFDDEEDS